MCEASFHVTIAQRPMPDPYQPFSQHFSERAALTPFEVLGLPRRFDVSASVLRTAWMRLLAAQHPDADGSVEAASDANRAYHLLRDPLSRADVLLSVGGCSGTGDLRLPDGFLLEMMELRERADEAQGDRNALSSLRAEAEQRRGIALTTIAAGFEDLASDMRLMTSSRASEIRTQMNVVRSFDRMLEQLDRESEAGGY